MTSALYHTNRKALRRWATERLSLTARQDGRTQARFVYEGSTCSNMGRSLRFFYDVTLGHAAGGYVIEHQSCSPDASHDGYQFMCEYRATNGALMHDIGREKPLLGHKLDDILSFPRASMAPSCYCEAESRLHKWGLVLETIHFALNEQQDTQDKSP